MLETYRWDDDTYTTIAKSGVPWRNVLYVLYDAPNRVRRYLSPTILTIAAPTPDGHWLAVGLVEEEDDHYLVVGARWMDKAEIDQPDR